MEKNQELLDPKSCLNKAADDEPLFVLRAHDKLAPVVIRLWADLAQLHGCDIIKVTSAKMMAQRMERYALEHGGKFPD